MSYNVSNLSGFIFFLHVILDLYSKHWLPTIGPCLLVIFTEALHESSYGCRSLQICYGS